MGILSFGMQNPTIVVCIAMFIKGIFPFGDKTVLLWYLYR